jgi:hypothetical protein
MTNPKPTIEEQIEALAWLRKGWNGDNSERAINAFNILDDGDVFADLDEERNDREAEASRIKVTVREVPGGWIALQDDDRSKVIAEAVVYDDLETRLLRHSAPVTIEEVISGEDEEDEKARAWATALVLAVLPDIEVPKETT